MRVTHINGRYRQPGADQRAALDSNTRQSWSHYWDDQDCDVRNQAVTGGRFGSFLLRHWEAVFRESAPMPTERHLLDLACGTGVVGHLADNYLTARSPGGFAVVGIDYSPMAAQHSPTGLVGDIARLPFERGRFGWVVSQFGIEYAGLPAFREAARVLAPQGRFAAVIHMKHGAIWRENASCLDILQCTAETGLLRKSRLWLETAYKLDRGAVAPVACKRRTSVFDEAARMVRQILQATPDCAAKLHVGRLLPDLSDLIMRRQNHDPQSLFAWIDEQARDLEAYSFRMQAMLDAAMTADEAREAAGLLVADHSGRIEIGALSPAGGANPAAWSVSVHRS